MLLLAFISCNLHKLVPGGLDGEGAKTATVLDAKIVEVAVTDILVESKKVPRRVLGPT